MSTTKHIPSLHDILGELFHDLKIEDRMAYAQLYKAWRHAVGEQISRNTHPVGVRGGILFVNVASSVWMQQLAFLKQEILEKLTKDTAVMKLKDIRFKIGPLPQSSRESSSEPLSELSASDHEQISRQIEPIADPELRETFRRVIAAHLRNRRQREKR